MCSTFKKYGICPSGINCKFDHNYNNKDINIKVALNVLTGIMSKCFKKVEAIENKILVINQKQTNLENKLEEKKVDEDVKNQLGVIFNKINTINKNLTEVREACRSKGLPLSSTLTNFKNTLSKNSSPSTSQQQHPLEESTSSTSQFKDKTRKNKKQNNQQLKLNKRAMELSIIKESEIRDKNKQEYINKEPTSSREDPLTITTRDEYRHEITELRSNAPEMNRENQSQTPIDNSHMAASTSTVSNSYQEPIASTSMSVTINNIELEQNNPAVQDEINDLFVTIREDHVNRIEEETTRRRSTESSRRIEVTRETANSENSRTSSKTNSGSRIFPSGFFGFFRQEQNISSINDTHNIDNTSSQEVNSDSFGEEDDFKDNIRQHDSIN